MKIFLKNRDTNKLVILETETTDAQTVSPVKLSGEEVASLFAEFSSRYFYGAFGHLLPEFWDGEEVSNIDLYSACLDLIDFKIEKVEPPIEWSPFEDVVN